MTNSDYYKDKISIVTGGNSGIGYALCEELLKRGAVVYMLGRNREKVEKAALKLSKYGNQIKTVIADVTVQEQVQKAIVYAMREKGRLDFLFNNAGVGGSKPFSFASIEDWKTIIDTNVWSVIYGVHTAVPIMLKQGSGHIINTSSFSGIFPGPYKSLYSLTKYAVTGLTESLKYEYLDKGLFFSTVCPGDVSSSIWKKTIDGKVHEDLDIPEGVYPADKAAKDILDGVSDQKGVIIIPKEPYEEYWKNYLLGDEKTEEKLIQDTHKQRKKWEELLKGMELEKAEYEEALKLL